MRPRTDRGETKIKLRNKLATLALRIQSAVEVAQGGDRGDTHSSKKKVVCFAAVPESRIVSGKLPVFGSTIGVVDTRGCFTRKTSAKPLALDMGRNEGATYLRSLKNMSQLNTKLYNHNVIKNNHLRVEII